jgi:hypothetical protein
VKDGNMTFQLFHSCLWVLSKQLQTYKTYMQGAAAYIAYPFNKRNKKNISLYKRPVVVYIRNYFRDLFSFPSAVHIYNTSCPDVPF